MVKGGCRKGFIYVCGYDSSKKYDLTEVLSAINNKVTRDIESANVFWKNGETVPN